MTGGPRYARIALEIPISDLFDYAIPEHFSPEPAPGHWVLVPWGRGRRVGLVIELADTPAVAAERIRPLLAPMPDAPAADLHWLELARFTAQYYHRSLGEVLLPAIPKLLRTPPAPKARGTPFERARARDGQPEAGPTPADTTTLPMPEPTGAASAAPMPTLTPAQADALAVLERQHGYRCLLLHGITGSGKTEVYLHWLATLLHTPGAQCLVLVPEIGLTPQLLTVFARRFPDLRIAVLHSDLPDGERARHWLAAADGRARIVIGTRLAVLAPLPALAGIVVDEEHDASYKQQEGVRYSARDLAIALAAQRRIPVLLGSATPSLESWQAARAGRYQLLSLPARAAGGEPPRPRVIALKGRTLKHGLSEPAIEAITATLARGQQTLVFLNRRGYAPVLSCDQCGWISRCETCSAYRVLHRGASRAGGPAPFRLMCHHCGADRPVPRSCPTCGNIDLTPLGRGTQRIEQGLAELFPTARVARLDRDVARRRGAAETVLAAAHAGDVDILVGTQMLAKGHDFERLALVVVVDADGGLYSSDFRAPERLFATLMQVAGRAGRSRASGRDSQVLIQTRFPDHPLFAALERHDYPGYAERMLAEREATDLPPYVHQALLRAEARSLDSALDWLGAMKAAAEPLLQTDGTPVTVFDPVPMALVRVANIDRAQLLVESRSRKALHRFLDRWLPMFDPARPDVRWQLDVDPLEI